MSKSEKVEKKDPFDGEYIGNIWGWRYSFIGLGIILFMFAVLGIRILTMGEQMADPVESSELPETLKNDPSILPADTSLINNE